MDRVLFIAVAVVNAVAGCADRATPDYNKCVDYEGKGMLELARDACVAASKADPSSKDGLAAGVKAAQIDAKLKEDKARVEAEAASRVAADVKTRLQTEDARCKGKKWMTKCMTGHRPDGTEKWTGMQQFDTRAECEHITSGVGTCDACDCQ